MHFLVNYADAVRLIAGIGIAGSLVFYAVSLYAARRFFRAHPRIASLPLDIAQAPGVTILKPLNGADAELFDNLSTFCRLDYPSYQIVFAVHDPADPAIAIVHRLQATYPGVNIDLVSDSRVYGTNYKVSNLHNAVQRAAHEVLVITDSDIRVGPDYLRRLVPAFADPTVGIVTCLYRALSTGGLATRVETLFINTDFSAMVLTAQLLERSSYAFGATIALRRSQLEEIGGFLSLADHLADDYHLGNRIAARGYRVVLSDVIVDSVLAVSSWAQLFHHQLRWARTYRNCRPAGYCGTILTHGTLWTIVLLLAQGFAPWACAVALVVMGFRMTTAATLSGRYLGAPLSLSDFGLIPLKDLFLSAEWALAFLGTSVRWGGRRFKVRRDGRMESIAAPADTVGPFGYDVRR